MLYFAYGSNLNVRHMKRMAPRAQQVCAAKLTGHKIVFRGHADIAPDAKSVVWGGLYELTDKCEAALDTYEDFPALYGKKTVTVDTDDGPREAMIYVRNDTTGPVPIAPPTLEYYKIVARGYADWKLDETPLKRARYATIGQRGSVAINSPRGKVATK